MRLAKALVVLVIVAVTLSVRSSAQTAATGPFVAGEILVKFRAGAAANARAAAHRAAGGAEIAEIQRTRVHRVRVPAPSW